MKLIEGQEYQVQTIPSSQSSSFSGVYLGSMVLAGGGEAHEFSALGSLDGMPVGTTEWYPVVLESEILQVEEAK